MLINFQFSKKKKCPKCGRYEKSLASIFSKYLTEKELRDNAMCKTCISEIEAKNNKN